MARSSFGILVCSAFPSALAFALGLAWTGCGQVNFDDDVTDGAAGHPMTVTPHGPGTGGSAGNGSAATALQTSAAAGAGGNGAAAAAGTTGSAGTTGVAGMMAVAGTTGAGGTTGVAGTTGSAGTTGVAGMMAVAGTTGAAGTTGVAGTTGAAGTTGVAGTTGAAGTTGVAGTTGGAGASGGAEVAAGGASGAAGSAGSGPPPPDTRDCTIKINEVQTGGTSALDEFIELYNTCPDRAVDLRGYTLLYRSATGATDFTRVAFTNAIIPAQHPFFICANTDYAGAADVRYTEGLAAAGGGIALRGPDGRILDAVAWGNASNDFMEGAPAVAPAPGQSIVRVPDGHDSENNAADFTLRAAATTPGTAN